MEAIHFSETSVLKEPRSVTTQMKAISVVIAVKNLKSYIALTDWVL
jgi:hypothetical protein